MSSFQSPSLTILSVNSLTILFCCFLSNSLSNQIDLFEFSAQRTARKSTTLNMPLRTHVSSSTFVTCQMNFTHFPLPPNSPLPVPNKIYKQLQFEKYRCFIFKNHAIDFHPYDLDKFLVMMYLDMLRAILGECTSN